MRQDEIVDELGQLFDRANVVDRRRKPSHGYRAVHVVPEFGDAAIELQVRTELQHHWAELSEKLFLVVRLTQFDDSQASLASDTRLELEISLHKSGVNHEVVLFDAASEEDLRRTHRRYFADLRQLTSADTAA